MYPIRSVYQNLTLSEVWFIRLESSRLGNRDTRSPTRVRMALDMRARVPFMACRQPVFAPGYDRYGCPG